MDEAYEAPAAVIGKFVINSIPAIVLFDTGASHSFISQALVEKHGLVNHSLSNPMMVTSPEGELRVSRACYDLNLNIGSSSLPTNLIILGSQGLNVIL